LRALATTSTERSSHLPDAPTFRESGYAGLDMGDWLGLFVSARTSPDAVERLCGPVRAAMRSGEVSDARAIRTDLRIAPTSSALPKARDAVKIASAYARIRRQRSQTSTTRLNMHTRRSCMG
jgi:tripartite-type tricarboxylate transporter receptor subunit TctC